VPGLSRKQPGGLFSARMRALSALKEPRSGNVSEKRPGAPISRENPT